MSRQRVLFILISSLLGFSVVFASSLTSNPVLTSLFRGGGAFVICLFIGLIFHIIWGFITLDLLKKDESPEGTKDIEKEQETNGQDANEKD